MITRADIANETNRKLYQNHMASMAKLREARLRIEQLEAALKDMKVVEWEAQHYRKRIHQLADALWKIIAMTPHPEFGTPPIDSAIEIAREALGVKGDFAGEFARAALEGKDEPR